MCARAAGGGPWAPYGRFFTIEHTRAVEALGALSWPQPRPGAGPLAVGAPEVDPTNPTKVCVPSPLARSFPSRVSLCLSLNNMPEP